MFGTTLRIFSLRGIPVRIHISWVIVFALVTWSFATGFYPENYAGVFSSRGVWLFAALTALLLFVSILLHELSHSLVARRDGIPMRGITLFMFGGVAQMGRDVDDPGVELRMAAAGPLMSLVLAVLFHLAARLAPGGAGRVLLETVGNINIGVLLFNLVPGFPLDGGRMLRAAIWQRSGDMRRATRAAAAVGTGFAWVLIGGGAIGALVYHSTVGGIWMVLIGLFLRQAASTSYRQVLWQQTLGRIRVGDVMRREVVTAPPSIEIERLVAEYLVPGHIDCVPVTDGGILIGTVHIDDITAVARDSWGEVTAGEVASVRGTAGALRPEDPAWLLYPLLAERDRCLVPVVDRAGRLAGAVFGRDVSDRIRVMTSLEG
jgi:Zn-dependent protease/predicted transcriptional regulator